MSTETLEEKLSHPQTTEGKARCRLEQLKKRGKVSVGPPGVYWLRSLMGEDETWCAEDRSADPMLVFSHRGEPTLLEPTP